MKREYTALPLDKPEPGLGGAKKVWTPLLKVRAVIIEAENLEDAKKSWVSKVHAQGFACNPVPDNTWDSIQLIPYSMHTWTNEKIMELYNILI